MSSPRLSMREAALQAVNLREISAPEPVDLPKPATSATSAATSTPTSAPNTVADATQPAPTRKRTERPSALNQAIKEEEGISQPQLKRPKVGNTGEVGQPADRKGVDGGVPVEPMDGVELAQNNGSHKEEVDTKRETSTPVVVDNVSSSPAAVNVAAGDGGQVTAPERNAGAPSSPTPGKSSARQDDSDSLIRTYGLYRVEPPPIPGDEESWLGCKFCQTCGIKKYKKTFFLARSPYRVKAITRHMKKAHQKEWSEFQLRSAEEKGKYFGEVTYPSREALQVRAESLMTAWEESKVIPARQRGISEKGEGKGKVGSKGKRDGDVESAKNVQNHAPQKATVGSGQVEMVIMRMDGSAVGEEKWAGRRLCKGGGNSKRETTDIVEKEGFRRRMSEFGNYFSPSSLSSLSECFMDLGNVHREVADLILNGVLSDKELRREGSCRGLLFPSKDFAKGDVGEGLVAEADMREMREMAAYVLFHLVRGVPPGLVTGLFQYLGKGRSSSGSNQDTAEYQTRHSFLTGNGVGSGVYRTQEDSQNSRYRSRRKHGADISTCGFLKSVNTEEARIWNTGNSICAQALILLRNFLSNRNVNAALLLTTRKCEEQGDGSVEFLLTVRNRESVTTWVHLVSVGCEKGAARALISVLNCVASNWRKRLVGVKSGLCDVDTKEKELEQAIVKRLIDGEAVMNGFSYIGREGVHSSQSSLVASGPHTRCDLTATNSESNRKHPISPGKAAAYSERNATGTEGSSYATAEGATVKTDEVSEASAKQLRTANPPFDLRATWCIPLPPSGDVLNRSRLGWCARSRTGNDSSRTVDPALERVMWARALICLHALAKKRPSEPKYHTRGHTRTLVNQSVEVAEAWGQNWANCSSLERIQPLAGMGLKHVHA